MKLLDLYFGLFINSLYVLEKIFGIDAIRLIAAVVTRGDMINRNRDFPQFVCLRNHLGDDFWKGSNAYHHYYKMVRNWHEGAIVALFYHRLGLPRWKKRFEVTGPLPQSHPEWGKRPVIFTFMHTGPFGLLSFWLRAQGIAVASLAGGLPMIIDNRHHCKVIAIGNRRFGLDGVPNNFNRYSALRDGIRFLTPGHALIIALDGGRIGDDGESCDADGFPILVKQGAVRIAARTNAILIPISVRRTSFCRFVIHFRDPVPDELVRDPDTTKASQHIVSALWPDIKEDPTDLNWTTLEELAPSLRTFRVGWP